jgi:hypothetical protein
VTAPLTRPEFTSQGTQIEQARAAADVWIAMEAAKRWPRDEKEATIRMLRVCGTARVAETAFWAFPRAGEQLTGSSVYLMRTIAQVWGNCSFGARELSRDENRRFSEMHAWAWDLQWNLRIEETFIVPWVIDKKDGGQKWLVSTRDIRDQLSNVAQRKVRTQIANMLPDEYVAGAEESARAVVEQTGRPIEEVRKEVGNLIHKLGVGRLAVLRYVGRDDWKETTRQDLAKLRIAWQTIKREESSVAELFPDPATESVESITVREEGARPIAEHAARGPEDAAAAPAEAPEGSTPTGAAPDPEDQPPAEPGAEPNPPDEDAEPKVRQETLNGIFPLFDEAGIRGEAGKPARLRAAAVLLGRPVESFSELTELEAIIIRDALRARKARDGVAGLRNYVRELAREDPA